MRKKLMSISILVVFMLVAISYATAVNTNTTNVKKKESPLYKIRTGQAINEKINKIIENIKTKFLGERIFFLPVIWLRKSIDFQIRYRLMTEEKECSSAKGTCDIPCL